MARVNDRSHNFTCQPRVYPHMERVLANISRSRYVAIATQPVHRLQIRPIVHNYWASSIPLPKLHPGQCNSVGMRPQTVRHRDTETSRLVLRPDCASSSECPQFGMPPSFDRCAPPRRRFNQNIPPSVVLLQQRHCRNRHRGKFKIYLLRQFCSNRVKFFFTIHRRRRRKKDGPEF